jgi:hypothetical protein
MDSEESRNKRRDKLKRSAQYSPKQNGLPQGFPKGYWLRRQAVKKAKELKGDS